MVVSGLFGVVVGRIVVSGLGACRFLVKGRFCKYCSLLILQEQKSPTQVGQSLIKMTLIYRVPGV